MAEIDSLEIDIQADASKASKSLDSLVDKLKSLAVSLGNVNTVKMNNIASGIMNISEASTGFRENKAKEFASLARSIGKLSDIDTNSLYGVSSAMQNLAKGMSGLGSIDTSGVLAVATALQKLGGVKASSGTANLIAIKDDLAYFVKGMNSIGGVNFDANSLATLIATVNKLGSKATTQGTANLPTLSAQLQNMVRQLNSIGALKFDNAPLAELVSSLSRMGGKSVTAAATNIPLLTTALQNMLTTLASAPTVSNNVIQMTNALANLASQGSRVGSASRTIQRSLNGVHRSAQTATKSVNSLASAFGKFFATYFLVIRGTKSLWKSIESTTDYIETFNYYTVAFNKIGSEWGKDFEKYGYNNATDYAQSFSDRVSTLLGKMSGLQVDVEGGLLTADATKNLGLNIQEITQYASQLASVTNSLGQTGETTTAIAKSMTMLAGDLSSLFNVDYSSVSKNLQSALIGQSRAVYKFGLDITNATLQTYAYNLGVEKSISEMTQMEKQQLRVLAILDQSKVSWGDLSNTLSSPSNQIRQFNTNIKETGMVLGQIFIPVLQKVMPVVNGVTIAIKRMLVSFATLMGVKIDFDAFGQNGYQDTTDGLEDIADGYDDVADAAKNAQKGVRGFDELNNISTGASTSDTSAGAGDTIDLTDEIVKATEEYEKVWNDAFDNMENEAEKWADRISNILLPIKNIFGDFAIGDFFAAGQDTSALVSGLFNWVAEAIDNVPWFTIGRNVGKYLAGLDWTEILKSAANALWQGFKGALEFYAGMFTAAPLETVVVSFMAMPGLLKAITASKFAAGVSKLWKKFVLLGNGAEAAVMALSGNQAAASALTFMFPGLVEKITAVKLAFTNFSTSVKNNGFWNAVGNGVTAVRNNLTGFQKGLIGVVSTAIEFTVLKDAFNDLTVGSDNMLMSIGKIAGVSAAAAGAMYLAFGPAGVAMAGITGVVAAISGIKKGLDEVEQSSMISALSIEGGATLEEFNQKATSTFDNVKEKAEETTQKISEIDTVKSNIADTVESIGTIYTAVESGAKNVEDEIPRFKSAFEQLKTDTESVLKQEYDVIVGYILGAVSDTTEALGGETPKAIADALGELYGVQENMLSSLSDTKAEYDKLVAALDNGEISLEEFVNQAAPLADKLSLTGEKAEDAADKIAAYGEALDLSKYVSESGFDAESFSSDIDAVVQSAQEGIDAVKNANNAFNDTFDSWMTNAEKQGETVSQKTQSIIDKYVGENRDKNLQEINDAYTSYANAVQYGLLEQLPSVVENATSGYESLNWWSKLFTTKEEYVSNVIGKWEKEVLSPANEAIQGGFNQLGIDNSPFAEEAAKKLVGTLFDTTTTMSYEGVELATTTLRSDWAEALTNALGGLKSIVNPEQYGKDMTEGFNNGTKDNISTSKSAIDEWMESIDEYIHDSVMRYGSPSKKAKQYGLWTVQGFAEGIVSNTFLANNSINKMFAGVLNQFSSKIPLFKPIGVQVMTGFLNGLTSMEQSVYSKADEIAENVAKTIQSALDIHSPSRVMFELGAYTTEGFKDGMESLYEATQLSAKDFGFGVVEAVHPQQLYSDYMSSTPTVSPMASTTTQNYYNSNTSVDNAETNALLRELISAVRQGSKIEIDGKTLGNVVRKEDRSYFQRTGRGLFEH